MTGESASPVANFGRNIRFTPAALCRPRSEAEVLRILAAHCDGTVRVVGAGHSWNGGIESPDALVDLRHMRRIRLHEDRTRVTVGAGCRIGDLLEHLARRGLTLPSIGLIDRQTVAGAVATGTHGSGGHSMSHYVEAMRIACYGPGGVAVVRTVDSAVPGMGEHPDPDLALRAARCSVGALGIVLEVTLGCVPQYHVREQCVWVGGVDEALERESRAPLQQFYLIPHSWKYLVHDRKVAANGRRAGAAALYRVYRLLVIDVLLHLGIKLTASLLRSRRLVHLLYRRLLRLLIVPGWRVTDRSDRQLLMRHDLFRHMEMEVFVRRSQLREALDFVGEVLRAADDAEHEVSTGVRSRIEQLGMRRAFSELRGTCVHHFPVCIRRVLPDDTLISMSSCQGIETEDWYSISLITYTEPRAPFERVARLIATVLTRDLGARLHWGKWFPPPGSDIEVLYPGLASFRRVRDEFDPGGVFLNAFLKEHLSGADER